jgi:hypothetical protein
MLSTKVKLSMTADGSNSSPREKTKIEHNTAFTTGLTIAVIIGPCFFEAGLVQAAQRRPPITGALSQ